MKNYILALLFLTILQNNIIFGSSNDRNLRLLAHVAVLTDSNLKLLAHVDENGNNPLHHAIMKDDQPKIKKLSDTCKWMLNMRNSAGKRPLDLINPQKNHKLFICIYIKTYSK